VTTESPLLRRVLFLLLALAITAGLGALAVAVLAPGGWTVWEVLILICFVGTVPWSALSAANALVGLVILLGARDPPAAVLPALRAARPGPPRARTAIAICVRNEDMSAVLPPLGRLMDGLPPDLFELWVLSDTPAGDVAEAEEAAFRAFAAERLNAHYRRRAASSTRPAGRASPGTGAPTRPTASTWSGSYPGGP